MISLMLSQAPSEMSALPAPRGSAARTTCGFSARDHVTRSLWSRAVISHRTPGVGAPWSRDLPVHVTSQSRDLPVT